MLLQMHKAFFVYAKYSSVTNMLLELKLPSFNTVLHNAKVTLCTSSHSVDNRIVHAINYRINYSS